MKQKFLNFLRNRTNNPIDTLRLVVLLFSSLMILICMPLHLFGIMGLQVATMKTISWIYWITALATLIMYYHRRFNLEQSFYFFGLTGQILETARMILLAILQPEHFESALIINQLISFTIVFYIVLCFLVKEALICLVLSIGGMLFAAIYSHAMNIQVVILFTLPEILSFIMGCVILQTVISMEKKVTEYESTQDAILHAFNMSKSELLAYIQLCRTSNAKDKDVSNFFTHLDERSEMNLINAVEKRKMQRHASTEKLETIFPQLTETELEVCRLVVGGHTLNEISEILGKSLSNIGTVRGNIRKKIGIHQSEDLRESLTKLMKKG